MLALSAPIVDADARVGLPLLLRLRLNVARPHDARASLRRPSARDAEGIRLRLRVARALP